MSACEEVNKYGLREYSFEIGTMDDSSETVAIVGQEYSSVSEDEKFYSKEDVDSFIAEKDRGFRRQKYKRCLAMALVWFERAENSTDWENELVSRKRFSKWMKLAEKFKEAK